MKHVCALLSFLAACRGPVSTPPGPDGGDETPDAAADGLSNPDLGGGESPSGGGGAPLPGDARLVVDLRPPDTAMPPPTPARDAGQSADSALAPVSCKRGVGYGQHSPEDMVALSRAVSWWYNWSPRPEPSVGDAWRRSGVEFVPMVWNGNFNLGQVETSAMQGAKYLLGFNEPNFFTQANLSPEVAAMLWPQLEQLARRTGLKLVSPAVNYCGPASACHTVSPFVWLDRFFAACTGCQVDYVAAHLYSCYGAGLRGYLQQFHKYGRPIWITEFSCAEDAEETLANQMRFMREAVELMENDPMVFRYSWFAGRSTAIDNVNLLGPSGQLTPLGELYASLPYTQACRR